MTDYLVLLGNDHCRAFLSLIRRCEGANYNTLFGGGAFSGWADHPRQRVTRQSGGRPLTSTAAGAYQFLARTWDDCRAATGSAPLLAGLAGHRRAVADRPPRRRSPTLSPGHWLAAIGKCNKEWASLPAAPTASRRAAWSFASSTCGGRGLRAAAVARGGEGGRGKGEGWGKRGGLPFPLPPSPFPGKPSPFPLPDFLQALRPARNWRTPKPGSAPRCGPRQPDGAARRRHRHREGLWLPHSARRRRDRYAGFCRCCCRRPVPVLVHHGHHPPHRPAARP